MSSMKLGYKTVYIYLKQYLNKKSANSLNYKYKNPKNIPPYGSLTLHITINPNQTSQPLPVHTTFQILTPRIKHPNRFLNALWNKSKSYWSV